MNSQDQLQNLKSDLNSNHTTINLTDSLFYKFHSELHGHEIESTNMNKYEEIIDEYEITDEISHQESIYSFEFQVLIYIMYNLVFVGALLGNLLVVIVVFSLPRMRTVTNYLIANLAIGDLLMAVLCVPFSYVVVLLQYWPFGETLCTVLPPAQAISVFVSAYTLVALAGDRYAAILYPLRPRLRRSQALVVIALVWVIALVTVIPIMMTQELVVNPQSNLTYCEEQWDDEGLKAIYTMTLMVLQYFFPLIVLIFTYTKIALVVWGKRAPGEAEDARDARLAKAKRKMIKMMIFIVFIYAVSWLPINLLLVLSDIYEEIWNWRYMKYVYPFVLWISQSHTLVNPIIYSWMSKDFRRGFCSVVNKIFCLNKIKRRNAQRPDSPTDVPLNSTRVNLLRTSPSNMSRPQIVHDNIYGGNVYGGPRSGKCVCKTHIFIQNPNSTTTNARITRPKSPNNSEIVGNNSNLIRERDISCHCNSSSSNITSNIRGNNLIVHYSPDENSSQNSRRNFVETSFIQYNQQGFTQRHGLLCIPNQFC